MHTNYEALLLLSTIGRNHADSVIARLELSNEANTWYVGLYDTRTTRFGTLACIRGTREQAESVRDAYNAATV